MDLASKSKKKTQQRSNVVKHTNLFHIGSIKYGSVSVEKTAVRNVIGKLLRRGRKR